MPRPSFSDNPLLRVSRPVSACSRCRSAKVKCDGKLPACTACEKAGRENECSSANDQFARGKERSYVAALELRIEKLERRLAFARSRKASVAQHEADVPPGETMERRDSLAVIKAAIHRKAAQRRENADVNSLMSDFGYLSINATTGDFEPSLSNMTFARLVLAAASNDTLPDPQDWALPPRQTTFSIVNYYMMNIYPRAAEALRAEFPTATIDVWQLDMASYDSVVAFARRCDDELPTIDYVLLNAGVQHLGFHVAGATGHESTLQINYLSTALLAILLVPVLRRKGATSGLDGRVPVLAAVGSEGQYLADPPAPGPVLAPLDCQRAGFVGFKQYLVSKLLLMAFMARLAEHVTSDEVVVTVVNPGLTAGSELGRETFQSKAWHIRFLVPLLMKLLARPLPVGASCYLDGMLVQAKAGHGSFCSEWSIKSWPAVLYTEEGKRMQDRLWQETLEELNFAKATSIIAGISKA